MPLNRPALTLGPGPRSLQDARRRVAQTCRDLGREELVECAELGVSELVSNALLHGRAPIQVRVRGTSTHPRIEVRDGSVHPPQLRPPPAADGEGEEDPLLTFGRGLTLVSRAAVAWGAEIEPDGKVVWFHPAAELSEGRAVQGIISGSAGPGSAPPEPVDPVEVSVLGVPLDLYVGFRRHFTELRREVRLLALVHAADYPLATALSDLFDALDQQLRDAVAAPGLPDPFASGAGRTDLRVRMPRAAATTLERFLGMLDLTDEFCRQHRLLTLARDPVQVAFQRWFLGEHIRQAHGAAASPWDPEGERRLG